MIELNGRIIDFTTFPNGETNIDGTTIYTRINNRIVFKYENDGDLIKLMFVKRHIDNRCSETTALTMLYMPYSRQDRVEGESVFTLKYVAEFINSLGFDEIRVLEPHSDVTPALLNNCKDIYPSIDILAHVMPAIEFDSNKDYLFYPDAGAAKRYASKISGVKYLTGYKSRDFKTGKIKSLEVVGETPTEGFKAIIIDDLCSYGGTFILSAEKLKALGATHIYLIVTHCENSIFRGKILNPDGFIDEVFTTDSILTERSILKDEISKINIFKGDSFL